MNSVDRDLSAKNSLCRKLPKLKAVCLRQRTGSSGHRLIRGRRHRAMDEWALNSPSYS